MLELASESARLRVEGQLAVVGRRRLPASPIKCCEQQQAVVAVGVLCRRASWWLLTTSCWGLSGVLVDFAVTRHLAWQDGNKFCYIKLSACLGTLQRRMGQLAWKLQRTSRTARKQRSSVVLIVRFAWAGGLGATLTTCRSLRGKPRGRLWG